MGNDEMWMQEAYGWYRGSGNPHGQPAPVDDLLDPFQQVVGYEAADPLLTAQLFGETPVSWPVEHHP